MNLRGRTPITLLAAATALLVVLPAGAAQAEKPKAGAAGTGITLEIKGKTKGVDLLKKVVVDGAVAGATPNENVQVTVRAAGEELYSKKMSPKADGSFQVPVEVNRCCKYVIEAENSGKKAVESFSVAVPKKLGKGGVTALFNRSLQANGFHTGTKGARVTMGTRLAIKAFRKTNGMGRSDNYRPSVFRKLLAGGGAFEPRYSDGRHVEVDISRQVMSLIEGDKPVHTFHVSTGASSTPTIRGNWRFYRKEPGYNGKRMYFSVYYIRGYATHGFSPVPNYPASHGCVRNPIPFSRFIYNWINIGDPIHVYN